MCVYGVTYMCYSLPLTVTLSLSSSLPPPFPISLQPLPLPVKSLIPREEFGNAVMVLEFLNTFGPLFNVREAIRAGVTIGEQHY